MKRRSLTLAGEIAANLADLLLSGKRSIILFFGIAVFSVVTNLISNGLGIFFTPWRSLIVGLGCLLFIALMVYFGIRWVGSGLKLRVIQDDNPPPCKALILFLSPVGGDRQTAEAIVNGSRTATIENPTDRGLFRGSWRMPLEAIAYHLSRLEKVVVAPSADSPGKEDGTHRDLDLFVRLVKKMCVNRKLEVLSPNDLGVDSSQGVDFEYAGALVGVLENVYAHLREKGYPDYDILIDITGGQKVPTVAGATVALDVGRRIQYVSLRDYRVRVYDFTVSSSK